MARAPCESEMAHFLSMQVGASTILSLSELATCLDGCRFCICWILDIPLEAMHTLRREASSCTNLRAVHTACCCCWHELNPHGNIFDQNSNTNKIRPAHPCSASRQPRPGPAAYWNEFADYVS